MIETLNERKIDLLQLKAIGCDETAANSSLIGGVIRLIESHRSLPLQWFVCMLHANELPLRHLFGSLDGATSGSVAFSGPIGKALATCEKLPIKPF